MSTRERAWRLLAPARRAGELLPARLGSLRLDGGPWPSAVVELAAGVGGHVEHDASRIAEGELSFWGHHVTVDPMAPDWRHDPLAAGRPAPAEPGAGDDPKPLWELHRQQHLFPLAAGARLGGNGGATEIALAQVRSWISDNRRRRGGPGWSSSYETAHRLVQWAWAIPLLADAADAAELDAIHRSYRRQARFVAARPSRYSSANNHRIAEIVGLLHVVALGGGDAAWRRLWGELEHHADAQAYADGGSREQAAGYFLYVLEMLWVAGMLARSMGRDLGGLHDQVARRLEWLVATGDSALEPPPFGDDAEDRIIRLEYFEPRRAQLIVDRAAGLLDDQLVLAPSRSTEPSARSSVLASGMTILRAGGAKGIRIAIDHGELGFGSLAAHGHADALSVLADRGGEPFLRDSGTGSYAAPHIRELLRSTGAHNTVEVGGTSQAVSLGAHMWGRRYAVTVEQAVLSDAFDYVRAGHDGYVAELGAVHRRSVLFLKPHLLLVTDRIEAAEPQEIALYWHVALAAMPGTLGPGTSLTVVTDPEAMPAQEVWPWSVRYASWTDGARRAWRVTASEVRFVSLIAFTPGPHTLRLGRGDGIDEIEIEGASSHRVIERWSGAPEVHS
ncbi:MAG: heparinase II/III-family protein [Gaiellaceae bacterium]